MYKLVAMDLDGTLFNQFGKISVNNLEALNQLKKRGFYIVIASGRTHDDILSRIGSLELDQYEKAYIISYNGVLGIKTKPRQVIYKQLIHAKDVRKIATLVENAGLKMHVFGKDQIFLSESIEYTIQSDYSLVETAKRVKMTEFNENDEIYKILVLDEETKLNQFQKTIPQAFLEDYTIFKSAPHLIEFVHKLGSKGHALESIASSLGLKREEIIAFGDEENDISMIQYAGMGIAMENGKTQVKKAAKAITLSHKLDGVAEALKKLIMMGEEKENDI